MSAERDRCESAWDGYRCHSFAGHLGRHSHTGVSQGGVRADVLWLCEPEASSSYHSPEGEDLFASRALCGATAATEPGGVLRMYMPGAEVTCAECRRMDLEAV